MLSFDRAASIDDLRQIARRRLPQFVFDFFDGACESEDGKARNEAAFRRFRLMPRYLTKVDERTTSTEIFGRTWAAPLGIAPTGLTGLVWPTADIDKGRAAAAKNLPLLLSMASSSTIEEVAAAAGPNLWFQLYAMRDWAIVEDLLRRCRAVGVEVLVLTIDIPVHGKRERDLRNGFLFPLKLSARSVIDFALCPAWSFSTLRAGLPRYANFDSYFPDVKTGKMSRTAFIASQAIGTFDWKMLARLRAMWPGKLVLKGVMAPEDIGLAAERDIDGVIISNHGGRQLDAGPAPVEILPQAVAAADGRIPVMLDSGVRRGADIVRAVSLGAAFTFVGRAPLYGLAAAGGQRGIDKALAILLDELHRAMGQIGVNGIAELGPQYLMETDWI